MVKSLVCFRYGVGVGVCCLVLFTSSPALDGVLSGLVEGRSALGFRDGVDRAILGWDVA